MRYRSQLFRLIVFFLVLTIGNSFRDNDNLRNSRRNTHHDLLPADGPFKGAWALKENGGEQVVVFIDNYFTHTAYSTSAKKFVSTQGGKYRVDGNKIVVNFEFSTVDKNLVGTEASFNYSIQGNTLNTDITGTRASWAKVDDGTGALAGNWQITGRMQGDKMNEMKPGARKTIKILTGTRFQWAAINTETREFSGTGGGTYTFKDGKYTENIVFFSRDSSRVGASLSFEGSVENGKWIHKGLSSRGEKIHEVWSRSALPM
ncbi:hypothetical protein ACX0G7_23205 [Flavitalea antarctica]